MGAREGCINFPVSLVALDLFVDPERHKVDLLKIDVEGHEAKVLLGGISLIKKYKPVIFFECLSDDAGLAVSSILEPIGYKFWMVDDLREVTVPIPQLKAELDSNGAIIMSRLNRIASCSMLKI